MHFRLTRSRNSIRVNWISKTTNAHLTNETFPMTLTHSFKLTLFDPCHTLTSDMADSDPPERAKGGERRVEVEMVNKEISNDISHTQEPNFSD